MNPSGVQAQCLISGQVTIASSKTFQFQVYPDTASAGDGLGKAVSSGEVEIFSELTIEKIA